MSGPNAPLRITSLAERWRPESLQDIVGQSDAVSRLRTFGNAWAARKGRPEVVAAVLEGPTGVGKTSAAYALAHDMGWNLVEMNASDARNEEALSAIAGRASITDSFTDDGRYLSASDGGRSLVLIDEVDALSTSSARRTRAAAARPKTSFREFLQGRYHRVEALNRQWALSGKSSYDSFDEIPKEPSPAGLARYPKTAQMDITDWLNSWKRSTGLGDEGGLEELTRIVRATRQPLILSANDAYAVMRASGISSSIVSRIRFVPVDSGSLRNHLTEVAAKEGYSVAREAIDLIAQRANGDVRAALNDLEALSALPGGTDTLEALAPREVESNLFEATRKLLSAGRFVPSTEVMKLADVPPDELLPWIDENIPNFAEDERGLSDAYLTLARADLHLFRANRWRIWVLWSYASELMTGGTTVSIFHAGRPGSHYRPPMVDFPSTFRRAGEARWLRDSVARKVGHYAHLSRRRTTAELLPFIERLFRGAGSPDDATMTSFAEFQQSLADTLNLDSSEVSFLLQSSRGSGRSRSPYHSS